MRRINVIGSSCAGKSSFASRLAAMLKIQHVELDDLHWNPGWQSTPPDLFRAKVATAAAADAWVIDGNYGMARDVLWPRVDTLIWLDYSMGLVFARALRRTARRLFFREPCCNGNRETLRIVFGADSILLWIWQTHALRRREFRRLLPPIAAKGIRVIRFRHPRDAEAWLSSRAAGAPAARPPSFALPSTITPG